MQEDIKKLINDLSDPNGIIRQKARHELVQIGKPAIDFLVELQNAPQHHTRWEALKTLSQIADPDSIPILINSLEDEKFDVRWLAAEGLIEIGKDSIVPLLKSILHDDNSVYLNEGVHHVLKGLEQIGVFKDTYHVIDSLENFDKHSELALAVRKTLGELE